SRLIAGKDYGPVSTIPGETLELDTPHGAARAHIRPVKHPRAALVLGHGAGGGVRAPDLLPARDAPGPARPQRRARLGRLPRGARRAALPGAGPAAPGAGPPTGYRLDGCAGEP